MNHGERPGTPGPVPPQLARVARELRLGAFQQRFAYRPGLPGVAFLLLAVVTAVPGLVRLVAGDGTLVMTAFDVALLALALFGVRRACLRFRGGVYLFEGGIAEAYGGRVKKAFTWPEVIDVEARRNTLVLYRHFPFPLLYEDEYLVKARRNDAPGQVDEMLLDRTLLGREELLRVIAVRAGVTGIAKPRPEPGRSGP